MKQFIKKFIFVFLIFTSLVSKATHNRSGEILYKRVPPYFTGTGTNTLVVYSYLITVIKYFDDGTGIADRCEDTVYFGDGAKAVAQRVNGTANCGGCANCGEIIVNQINYRVKKNIYTCTHTYSGPGVYLVSSTDANRSQGINNIVNSDQVPFSIQSVIVTNNGDALDSSPVLTNQPIYFGSSQNCYYFNPYAFDPDGDSLSFELVPCMAGPNQTITGYYMPSGGTGGTLSIDPSTGLLSWCNPQFSDAYSIAIRVNQFRKPACHMPYQFTGYVTRDMEIIIEGPQSFTQTASGGNNDCVVAGSVFSRNITASLTGASGFSVSLSGFSNYPGNTPLAVLSSTAGGALLSSTFNWQTNCTHVKRQPHQIGFIFQRLNRAYYAQFNLKVIPPAPFVYNVTTDTNKVTLHWNKITGCSSNIKGYNIYRKAGSNTWSPAPCETGVSANSGFQYIGFSSAADSSYIDHSFYPLSNGSTANYVVTAIMSDCSESFASIVKTVTLVLPVQDLTLKTRVKIYPNPFVNQLELEIPSGYSGVSNVSVYAVDGKLVFANNQEFIDGKAFLHLGFLDRGIYFLRLLTDQHLLLEKVIRN